MPTIGPVTDQYIDSIIKSAGVANPNLNKTQGTGMRELIKRLRDRLEQEIADNVDGLITHSYSELKALADAGTLVSGQQYVLSDYKTIYIQPVSNLLKMDAEPERLLLTAATESVFFNEAKSIDHPADYLEYDFSKNIVTMDAVEGWYNVGINILDDVGGGAENAFISVIDNTNSIYMSVPVLAGGTQIAQGHLPKSLAPYSVAMTGIYLGSGFKVKINDTVILVNAYDYNSFDESGDYSSIPRITSNITANGSIQIYSIGHSDPDEMTFDDNSAGTPAVAQDRPGWITFRRDANENSAYFDFSTVLFRRWAVNLESVPDWTTGGSYNAFSVVKVGTTVYGVVKDVTNDPNENIDTNTLYIQLVDASELCLANVNFNLGPFSLSAAATFRDTAAFDVENSRNISIGDCPDVYFDNLPNVILTNTNIDKNTGISFCTIGSGSSDCYLDKSSGVCLIEGVTGAVLINSSGAVIGKNSSSIFLSGSLFFNMQGEASSNAVCQSDNVYLGKNSYNTVVANCNNVRTTTNASQNILMSCNEITFGVGVINSTFINVSGANIDNGCNSNNLSNCTNISFGMDCSGNTFVNATNLGLDTACNNNAQSDQTTLTNTYLKAGASSNIFSGDSSLITLGLFSTDNQIHGYDITLSDNCSSNIINNAGAIDMGPNSRQNVIGPSTAQIKMGGYNISVHIGSNCSDLEFGLCASNYTIGDGVNRSYFRDAFGGEIGDNLHDLVPWSNSDAGGGTPSYTFTNGLTESSGTVKLGGAINDNVDLSLSNHDLVIHSESSFLNTYASFGWTGIHLRSTAHDNLFQSRLDMGETDSNFGFIRNSDGKEVGFQIENQVVDIGTNGFSYRDDIYGRGLQYSADYSATFTNRSLVDKSYVDNAIANGGTGGNPSTYTFSEGLKDVAGVVTLGGTINQTLPINITELGTLQLLGNDGAFNTFGSSGASLSGDDGTWNSLFSLQPTGSQWWINETTGDRRVVNIGLDHIEGFMITDSLFSRGARYAADYSANYTERSLVDKAYVDAHIGGSGNYNFSSGLSQIGNNVTLGGPVNSEVNFLLDPFVGINLHAYDTSGSFFTSRFQISGGGLELGLSGLSQDNSSFFQLTTFGNYVINRIGVQTTAGYSVMQFATGGGLQNGILIQDDTGFGVAYNADYSANFTARTLVDKAYVDTAIAAAIAAL